MSTISNEDFTREFEAIRGPMKSYIIRITASKADAEDIVQDTYIKGLEKLDTFRGDSSLKTWLFTIASNKAKNLLKSQKRWPEDVTDICKAAALSSPEHFQKSMEVIETRENTAFEIREHIAFCFTCISKSLPLEQHLCLLLKEVYGFKVGEIATIMEQTDAMVKYYLHTGRSKMIQVFEGRCALINKQGVCHQCTEINGIFNPQQNEQEELAKIAMVKAAEKGDKEHLFDLRIQVLKDIDPFESGAADLQLHHLEFNRKTMENYLKDKSE